MSLLLHFSFVYIYNKSYEDNLKSITFMLYPIFIIFKNSNEYALLIVMYPFSHEDIIILSL
jgi:hypothetical protein